MRRRLRSCARYLPIGKRGGLPGISCWTPCSLRSQPNIDGYVIPESPAAVFERGEQSDVPLLGGWCKEEHAFFMSHALPHSSASAFRTAAANQFGRDRLADFLSVYPAANRSQAKRSAEQLVGDL